MLCREGDREEEGESEDLPRPQEHAGFPGGRAAEILERIEATPASETEADQWQSQIFARVLKKCRVVLISKADPELVRSLQMVPAANMEEALAAARELVGREGSIVVIPQGVATIVTPED